MIVTSTYQRKTFRVHAIRVTEENMAELAQWCEGELKLVSDGFEGFVSFIDVRVSKNKYAAAEVGDWITHISEGNNFRVYRNRTFIQAFEEIRSDTEKYWLLFHAAREVLESQVGNKPTISDLSDKIANKLVELI